MRHLNIADHLNHSAPCLPQFLWRPVARGYCAAEALGFQQRRHGSLRVERNFHKSSRFEHRHERLHSSGGVVHVMENAVRFNAIECPFELTYKKQISMQELNIGDPITFGLAHRVGKARPAQVYGEY